MLLSNVIEIVFSLCMFINAFLFIPQAIKIIRTKIVKGLSLMTFLGFNIIQLFTILHAYLHRDYLLLVGILLSFMTCSLVTGLIVLYQYREQSNCPEISDTHLSE